MSHLAKPCQGLDVCVDQVARPLPRIPLHQRPGLQVPQSPQSEPAEDPGHGGERDPQQPRDVPEVQALSTDIENCATSDTEK